MSFENKTKHEQTPLAIASSGLALAVQSELRIPDPTKEDMDATIARATRCDNDCNRQDRT